MEASQITQNWMQAAAAAAAAAAVNSPQGMATTSGPPQTPPAMGVAPSLSGSPPGQAGQPGCTASNPNIPGKGKFYDFSGMDQLFYYLRIKLGFFFWWCDHIS